MSPYPLEAMENLSFMVYKREIAQSELRSTQNETER